ncbi:O-methyltransferase [Alkalihalobacterium chitinilyticum]|uniref:tRNA 5-hydroxyuridine methyltransferase n=1 Tax=Alkalihalobacterium chitinilyticum TaxID=2980103 RepID=A0ABT5VG83_9BACI|nr:O-methyltransferase [Alkalihalobacterium chitinilyticum]MDE5413742.1 O-methyltransferase [Alkalihalobacterium chitinilyticum]
MLPNNDHKIDAYIESLICERNELLIEMEQLAKEQQVPIMELVGIETLLQLLRMKQPKSILEIGTAIGYSAIRMAQAVDDVKIITIERDEPRYKQALEFVERANVSDQVEIIFGDALHVGEQLELYAPFDVLFIDAAKGQYEKFFQIYEPLVRPGGLIISDNVLFRGLVAEEYIENKNHAGMAKKLRRYNEWLMKNEQFTTTILPVGDGIALSIKK